MHRDEGSEMWPNPFRLLRSFAQTILKCFFFCFCFFGRPASSESKSRKNCDYRKQTSLNKQGGVKRLLILVFIDSNALTVCFPAKLICEFQVVSKVTRHPPPRWNYRGKMFVTVKHWERVINILSLKHGAIPRQLLTCERTELCFGCFSSGYEVLGRWRTCCRWRTDWSLLSPSAVSQPRHV